MKKLIRFLSFLFCVCLIMPLGVTWVSAKGTDENNEKNMENLALGKTVKASSGTQADAVADGNLASYWDSTENGRAPGPCTVTLDLGYAFEVSEVTVVTYYGDGRYYHFSVDVSSDGENYTRIGDKTDNSVATQQGTTYAVEEERIRYVKVTMNRNSANPEYHICELIVMGLMDPNYVEPTITEDPYDPNNVAIGKPTRANYNTILSKRVTDGEIESSWNGNAYPQYVDVDLLDNYDISEIIVYMPTTDSYTYTVYGSLDGVKFDRIADSNVKKPGSEEGEKFIFEKTLNYRVIRVNVTSAKVGGSASVCEIKVHGKKNNTAVIPTRDKLEFTSYDEWLLENHGVDTSKLKDENGNYNIEDTYTQKDTVDALKGLVSRILGDKYNDWFEFDVVANTKNDYDYFEISGGGNAKVKIVGNDGVAIASGLNHYLKYYCNVNVSQQTKQVAMPAAAPAVEKTIRKDTPCEVRYAYNYCTLSYTMQFYGFDKWQRELDYLMLQGVNVILDTTATEALWVMYLQQYGYTAQEAIDFVCGYAYKAWWLMGNLENYGGSVADQWIYDTLEMARVNQRYMTVMGCMPCLQVFAGTLPTNFADKASGVLAAMGYDDLRSYMSGTGAWTNFIRPFALNTTFPGFARMANDFYETQNHLYGQITDYYAGDFLHELMGGFQLDESFNKANMSRVVLDLLINENPEGCWIMQSWWENPLPDVVAGFGEDREDHVLMLDLAAVNDPRWKKTTEHGGKEFGGTSWVYCMLDNYGGRTGMHGAFTTIMNGLLDAYQNAEHLKGIGITPEGTEENPVSYDFFWELVWVGPDDIPNNQKVSEYVEQYVKDWVSDYAKRRYGIDSPNILGAWDILRTSVYGHKTYDGTSTNTIITSNPRLFANGNSGEAAYTGGYFNPMYEARDLEKALLMLMNEYDKLKDCETYIYDICDIMVQLVTNSSGVYLEKMATAINEKNYDDFVGYKVKFLRCMQVIDEVSMYTQDTMLGNWIGRIDEWVNDERTGEYSDYDIDTMKHNALILITTWSSGTQLIGYANREYAGLISEYHYRNWKEYLDETEALLLKNQWHSAETQTERYFQYAWELIVSRGEGLESTPRNPEGDDNGARDLSVICSEIFRKLRKDSEPYVSKLVVTDASAGYTIENKQLCGIEYGVSVRELKRILKSDNGGSMIVLDPNGNQLSENEYLTNQCKVVLMDESGIELDALTVVKVSGGPGISFEEEKLTVQKGASISLRVNYLGTNVDETVEFVYVSSDPSIATVDADGKITGVAAGTTTITVTAGDYTDTIEVTVIESKVSGFPVWAIILIVVAAVAVIAGAVTFFVLKNKK